MPHRNTLVQLLALYTDPESDSAQRYRRRDDMMMPIADHTVQQYDRLTNTNRYQAYMYMHFCSYAVHFRKPTSFLCFRKLYFCAFMTFLNSCVAFSAIRPPFSPPVSPYLHTLVVLVVALVGRWTRDRKVTGSTPGRGAIKSTRSTQPSISPGLVNRVGLPACMAGVKAGCVHLCRVAGNTV